jgi:hypothetical protein
MDTDNEEEWLEKSKTTLKAVGAAKTLSLGLAVTTMRTKTAMTKQINQSQPQLLPTPTAQAAKHGETPDTTAQGFGSNLWDIPTLIGEITNQQSEDGKPSQTGQPQTQRSQVTVDDQDSLPFS